MNDKDVRLVITSFAAGAGLGALLLYRWKCKAYPKAMIAKKKWLPPSEGSGGRWNSINAPTSGARMQKVLPRGEHAIQLYSWGSPNGVKVTILLEELVDLVPRFEYDAWLSKINGDQFGSDFVAINPNSKIPCILDTESDTRVFESGSILVYLCDKYDKAGHLLPKDLKKRTEVMNWVFWQMGSAPCNHPPPSPLHHATPA